MTGARRIFVKNAGFNLAGFAVESIGLVLLVPYAINRLGLEAYGLVTGVLAAALAAEMLGQAVAATTIRQVAAARAQREGGGGFWSDILNTRVGLGLVLTISLVTSVVVFAGRSRLLDWLGIPAEMIGDAEAGLDVLGVALPGVMLSTYLTSIVRGRQEFRRANVFKVTGSLFRVLGIVLYFELVGPAVAAFVLIRLASSILEGILASLWFFGSAGQSVPPNRGAGSAKTYSRDREMAVMVGGLMLYAIGNVLSIEFAKLMVGSFHGLGSLGILGASAMAISFLQRLVQAAAVALNPLVSSLDSTGSDAEADAIVYDTLMVSIACCGALAVGSVAIWRILAPLWLQNDVGVLWVVPALMFAAQGTNSAIAPLVQAAYGRGRVFGLSAVHVGGSGVVLAVSYWSGLQGAGFVTLVGALAAGRVLTSVATAVYLGLVVFPSWPKQNVKRMIGGLVGPWVLAPLALWAAIRVGSLWMDLLLAGGLSVSIGWALIRWGISAEVRTRSKALLGGWLERWRHA